MKEVSTIDVDGQLTDRQREIKDLLTDEMSAREIGDRLGISRNAVYQQIQALRRKGALESGFTPSGMPAREHGSGRDEPAAAKLVRVLARTADELERLAQDIRANID